MNMPTNAVAVPTGIAPTTTGMATAAAVVVATTEGEMNGPHNGREARNLAEKHRRDKLNASIQELSTMVPHVAEATRRLDKTAVLRFAAHGLRLQHVFGKSTTRKRHAADDPMDIMSPSEPLSPLEQMQQQQSQLTDALMQLLDSFFITLTCHGQIVLVSASVEQLLGHCQSDLYGQNIMHITHPADQELMRRQLIPCDMDTLFRHDYQHSQRLGGEEEGDDEDDNDEEEQHDNVELLVDGDNSESSACNRHHRAPSPRTQTYLADIDRRLRADRRCFTVRLARAGTRSEAQRTYEIVKIDGCFRRSDCSTTAGSFPIVSQLIRRSRNTGSVGLTGAQLLEHDIMAQAALHGVSGNDIVLVALARIIRPPKIWNRLFDPNQLEYRTRHLIDGRIVDCDQRIGLVAGYMREEVRNLSPFSFIHLDDVRWVIVALRQMYDCNSDYGESCYRLLTRNGHFIYLQTKGYLEIDKRTNKVHSFLCVNTLLGEQEGRRKVQEMKDKFSVIIKTKIPSNSLEDVPASQNPQQLERIVLYLIENLQKRHDDSGSSTGSVGASGDCLSQVSAAQLDGFVKLPPLSLVPPPQASVKNSISKSVSVVNVTAAKNLTRCHKSSSSSQDSEASLSPASSLDQADELPMDNSQVAAPQRASVLRVHVLPASTTTTTTKIKTTTTTNTIVQKKLPVVVQLQARNSSSVAPTAATVKNCKSASPPAIVPVATATPKPPVVRTPLPASQMLQQQVSVLKRLHSSPGCATIFCSDDSNSPAKRISTPNGNHNNTTTTNNNNTVTYVCQKSNTATANDSAEYHNVLSSSLRQLDQSLHTIGQGTRTLCQTRAHLLSNTVPRHKLDSKLDAIIVEHHEQERILGNIKNEYSVHMQQQQQ